jgi:hypothetical protein
MLAPMTNWNDLLTEAPELADAVQARIDATGLAFLATLRRDGSPRISGIEPLFALGELWLGMMPGSFKAKDLQRDPRLSLHNATEDKAMQHGDVKISGRGIEVTDHATETAVRSAFAEHTGYPPPEGPMHLFRVDVAELVMIRPATDHLVIETWHEGRGTDRIERY